MARRSTPFHSILVPVDGSRLAEQAVPVALAIAERAGSSLRLVLVHQPPLLLEPGPAYTRVELALQRADREYLKTLGDGLRERLGDAVSTVLLQGPAAQTLDRYIHELGVDLVVMTTHGRGGLRRAWLGSVADQLVRAANVPILLVRVTEDGSVPAPADFNEILVPLDGSRRAEAALEPASTLARLWDGEISLVQIVPPVVPATERMIGFAAGYDQPLTAIRRKSAEDYIRDVAEQLRQEGVKASGIAVLGSDIADRLLGLALPERVGLVVIASHGRGGVRRLVLGSVADKLVRAADVPVLVCRPTGKRSKRTSGAANVPVGARTAV